MFEIVIKKLNKKDDYDRWSGEEIYTQKVELLDVLAVINAVNKPIPPQPGFVEINK